VLQTPFGLCALTYAVVAFVVGSLQDSVLRAAWWIPLATASAGSILGVILYFVFGTMVGVDFAGVSIPKVAVLVGVLNAILAPPAIRIVRWATGTQDSVRARAVYR
jgi:cell shape-determining protein MreD